MEVVHIGYCTKSSERGKHYATQMLGKALQICDAIGISEVIVICDKSNIASARVIKNCGGVLESEFYSNVFEEEIQKYIINR